jgi:endonuclease G
MNYELKKYVWILGLSIALTACRGNSNGQDAAAQDLGEEATSFFQQSTNASEQNSDSRDASQQKKNKKRARKGGIEVPAPIEGSDEIILSRIGYTTSYNPSTKIPNWVAWHLTAAHTNGHSDRHENMFHEDTDVPQPRVTDDDYYNSGFDRGHMCPAGDNKWDREALRETFLFTNMCPQVHRLNSGPWNDLEIACRRWARQYGDLYIVCGPLLDDGRHRTIGRRRVVVPERFFKVVLAMDGKPKAIGFIYDNNGRNSEKMFSHATTVDEVERLTGIDFFPQLDDKIENVVEATRGYF